jgi:hypothetical protein
MEMILYRTTPRRNVPSILRHGLLTAKSQGKMAVIWLHSAAKRDWAKAHVMQRHNTLDTATFAVHVSRSTLKHAAGTGLWYSTIDIPPGRLALETTSHDTTQ